MPTVRIPIDLTWVGSTGSPGVNVFHGRIITGGISSDLQDLTDALQDFYQAIAPVIPNQVTVRWAGEAAGVGDDAGTDFTSPAWTVPGTSSGGYAPPAATMLVQWRTGSGGRSGRGRSFISPVTNAIVESNGTPDETARGIVQDAVDDLIGASSGFGDGALGVYSRTEDVFRDFTSGTVPNYFASLRSRRD